MLLLLLGGMLGTASAIVINNVEVWSVGDLNIYLTNHQGEEAIYWLDSWPS
jgi:hypothetical protein